MSKSRLRILCSLMMFGLWTGALPAHSITVAELEDKGRLQVRTWLEPARDIVPGQQVRLYLEIATDRWFTGGTRIRIPEVPGLVILQTDDFASNSSEQRKGQSWVVQRWTLEVYAQRESDFTIPPISARIRVSGDGGETVEGELTGPSLRFSARRPESLARISHWVAAPAFTVSQSFDRVLDKLSVGDAIEREVLFEANEVMAMMLPTFTEDAIAGLTAYREPPQLNNRSNRGTTVASRRERITYIVEREGQFQLPARDYFWWDIRSGELQLLSLPTVNITAGPGAVIASDEAAPDKIDVVKLIPWIIGVALSMLLAWLAGKLPLKAAARRVGACLRFLRWQWRELRKPALPERLNPGNSSAD